MRVDASQDTSRQFGRLVNFYRVLGLRPGADGEKIKAAYRRLVKQFHPDFNAGDARAEQLTKELNHAYQTLAEPKARSAYDIALARQRTEARRRFLQSMATGVAAFMLTIGLLIPLATFWGRLNQSTRWQATATDAPTENERIDAKSGTGLKHSVYERGSSSSVPESVPTSIPLPQHAYRAPAEEIKEATSLEVHEGDKGAAPTREEGTGMLSSELAIAVSAAVRSPATPLLKMRPRIETAIPALPNIAREQTEPSEPAVSPTRGVPTTRPTTWAVYRNTRLGFALKYPADVFTTVKNQTDNNDSVLTSKDGRALLRISSMQNGAATTLAQYRRSLIAKRYADARFDYAPQRHNWFVLSGTVGEEMFYERVTYSCDGRSIHSWLLAYPIAERLFFDAIVEEMHRTYRYGLGPNLVATASLATGACSAANRRAPKATEERAFRSSAR
jgi:curved DNA-binding protein CbpA